MLLLTSLTTINGQTNWLSAMTHQTTKDEIQALLKTGNAYVNPPLSVYLPYLVLNSQRL
ncbi:MAG: hypothetical protein ACJAZA_001655 [Shewanella psychromarinicola]|jgi:hypothetical protein